MASSHFVKAWLSDAEVKRRFQEAVEEQRRLVPALEDDEDLPGVSSMLEGGEVVSDDEDGGVLGLSDSDGDEGGSEAPLDSVARAALDAVLPSLAARSSLTEEEKREQEALDVVEGRPAKRQRNSAIAPSATEASETEEARFVDTVSVEASARWTQEILGNIDSGLCPAGMSRYVRRIARDRNFFSCGMLQKRVDVRPKRVALLPGGLPCPVMTRMIMKEC